jgi:hypothetical protein
MIAFKWVLLGLAVSFFFSLLFHQVIIGVVFGAFSTLIADTYSAGKRVVNERRY